MQEVGGGPPEAFGLLGHAAVIEHEVVGALGDVEKMTLEEVAPSAGVDHRAVRPAIGPAADQSPRGRVEGGRDLLGATGGPKGGGRPGRPRSGYEAEIRKAGPEDLTEGFLILEGDRKTAGAG